MAWENSIPLLRKTFSCHYLIFYTQNSDLDAVYHTKKRPTNCNIQRPVKRKSNLYNSGFEKSPAEGTVSYWSFSVNFCWLSSDRLLIIVDLRLNNISVVKPARRFNSLDTIYIAATGCSITFSFIFFLSFVHHYFLWHKFIN
mgnify:CR=1 FL=1